MSADLILYTYPPDAAVIAEATILHAVNYTISGADAEFSSEWTDNGDGTFTQTGGEWRGMHHAEYCRRMAALRGHLTGRVFVCEDYDYAPVPMFGAVLDLIPAPTRVTPQLIACVMVAMNRWAACTPLPRPRNRTVRPNERHTVEKRQRVRRFLVAHLGEYVVAGVE